MGGGLAVIAIGVNKHYGHLRDTALGKCAGLKGKEVRSNTTGRIFLSRHSVGTPVRLQNSRRGELVRTTCL